MWIYSCYDESIFEFNRFANRHPLNKASFPSHRSASKIYKVINYTNFKNITLEFVYISIFITHSWILFLNYADVYIFIYIFIQTRYRMLSLYAHACKLHHITVYMSRSLEICIVLLIYSNTICLISLHNYKIIKQVFLYCFLI